MYVIPTGVKESPSSRFSGRPTRIYLPLASHFSSLSLSVRSVIKESVVNSRNILVSKSLFEDTNKELRPGERGSLYESKPIRGEKRI